MEIENSNSKYKMLKDVGYYGEEEKPQIFICESCGLEVERIDFDFKNKLCLFCKDF